VTLARSTIPRCRRDGELVGAQGVVRPVVTFMMVEPEPFTDVGSNVAVLPEGRPLTLKVTVPVAPVPATLAV